MHDGLIVDEHGTRRWFVNDQLHRPDGPAIEYADGTREWYRDGQLHRTDGSAVEHANGTCEWWLYGVLHRENGPAVEGDGFREWWLNGEFYTFREWLRVNTKLTPRQKTVLMLKYGDR